MESAGAAPIGGGLLWPWGAAATRTSAAAAALNGRLAGSAGVAYLTDRLTGDASSALAVYVPDTDVLGDANADGHEVDFFAEDLSHRPYHWAYRYDAATQTVTRYSVAPGGAIAGEAVARIAVFAAMPERVSDLAGASSAAYDPLFAGSGATDIPYVFPSQPNAIGGNRLVALHVAATGAERRVTLATADAPTAFTIVGAYTPSPAPPVTPTPAPLALETP